MLPVPQLWSVLFFFMLLLLGIDSQVGLVEGSMTSLLDMFPHWRRYRPAVLAVFSGIALLLGLPMITRGGMYVFQLLDYYVFGGFVLQLLCLFEVLVAAWLYVMMYGA
nr:hypothetical protein BaRGS_022953 [Batillaria attramentaria]